MQLRVVVVDDQPAISSGIQHFLSKSGAEVVATVNNQNDLPAAYQANKPDVLVMEVRLGGKDALKSLEPLLDQYPDCKVVVYSAFTNPSHIARAAALGCHDYVLKTSPLDELSKAIARAANNDSPPEDSLLLTTKIRMKQGVSKHDPDIPLTHRELQVLKHVAMGLSNREVGKALVISVETVKEHVQNILRKLDVNDRTQAAVWAVRRDIV